MDEKISSRIIADRIYKLHQRVIIKYLSSLKQVIDISKCNDRKIALEIFLYLQKDLFAYDIKNIPILNEQGDIVKTEKIPYTYDKLIMCVDNLQNILFSEINGKIEYLSQERYARPGETVEYGKKVEVININGQDAYGNIYRK